MDQFGESVVISVTDDILVFSATGTTGATGSMKLSPTNRNNNKEDKAVTIVMKEPVTLTFGCRSVVLLNCWDKF